MLDFVQSKKEALEFIQRTLTVSELTNEEKELAGFNTEKPIWEIKTEYFLPSGSIKPVKFQVALPSDFPLVMPEVFVANEFIKDIGFVPHVDSYYGYVCLYDSTSLTLDTSRPGEIIKSAVERAIKIIEDGLLKTNADDVADEFVAYWNARYSDDDKHERGLNMINQDEPALDSLKIVVLNEKFKKFGFVLHDESEEFKTFSSYLKSAGRTLKEHPTFYLGTSSMISPPFDSSNGDIASFIVREFPDRSRDFNRFVSQLFSSSYLVFSMRTGDKLSFFGWHLPFILFHRKGFRPGILTPIRILGSFQKNYIPLRLITEEYTTKRLQKRTSGVSAPKRFKYAFAGLGSIGSNLVPYFLSLETSKVMLIDFDILTMENINRHLLGMSYIGDDKVLAMKNYLEAKDPLLKAESHKKSIIDVINRQPADLNENDIIVVAIGVNNIEEYISIALAEEKLTKPVLFFWVEPYLMGGHCVYLRPGHKVNFKEMFQDGLYKYNMISPQTYRDPGAQIKLREAGCQTSYVPYGRESISRFLSAIMPTIYEILENDEPKNLAISWRNNVKVIDGFDILLSDLGNTLENYEVRVNKL